MGADPASLLAIACMALVTYAVRAGGPWLMGRLAGGPRIEAGLRYLPGGVLTAIVVPAALEAGPAGVAGVVATGLVAGRSGSLLLAVATGVGVVWLLRNLT